VAARQLLEASELPMTLIATAQETLSARKHHVLAIGTAYYRTAYIGGGDAKDGPTCFLVEQAANSIVEPHFHQADQFQVFVAGEGTLGKHTIAPVVVHYVNAFTPYGPIKSHSDGIHYFTLRNGYDPGARFLPGAVKELPRVARRHATSKPSPLGQGPGPSGTEWTNLLEGEADGLAAYHVKLAGGRSQSVGGDRAGGGEFWVVLRGSLELGTKSLSAYSCLHRRADEERPVAHAGREGAELVVLQFPVTNPKPGHG
jgi:hypothetical protein